MFLLSVGPAAPPWRGRFFFFIFKKNQNFKNICLFWKISKIYPGRPMGTTGLKCNFFLQICNEVPGEKKEGGLSPPQRATGPCRPPQGRPASGPAPGGPVAPPVGDRGGPVAPPHGRPGQAAYIRPPPHSLHSFDLKKSKKSRKKRGVRRREAAKLCRIPHL